jgi:hypothetical protein
MQNAPNHTLRLTDGAFYTRTVQFAANQIGRDDLARSAPAEDVVWALEQRRLG